MFIVLLRKRWQADIDCLHETCADTGTQVSPVPRQASASKAFKGLAWKGRRDACKNYTPFLLDLGEKNNQKCDIPYVL